MQHCRRRAWWVPMVLALVACNALDDRAEPLAAGTAPRAGSGAIPSAGTNPVSVPDPAATPPDFGQTVTPPPPPVANPTPPTASGPPATPSTGGADAGLPACPLAQQRDVCEASQYFELQVLATAEEIGTGAELLAADGQMLLARDPDGVSLVIDIPIGLGRELPSTVHTLPEGQRALDLIRVIDATYVLACASESSSADGCRLLAIHGALAEVPSSRLPDGFEPTALVHGPATHIDEEGRNLPCAVGRGVACFTGEGWELSLQDEIIVSASMLTPAVAITADGRALLRDGDTDDWRAEPALEGSSLRWADHFRDGAGMLVEPEVWASVDGAGAVTRCALGEPFELLRIHSHEPRFLGATADGRFVHFAGSELGAWCDERPLSHGPVIDIAIAGCGISSNPRVLTADVLLGSDFCAID